MELPSFKVALDLGVGSIGVAVGYTDAESVKDEQNCLISESLQTFVHIYKPASSNYKRRAYRLNRKLLKTRAKRKQLLWQYLSSISNKNFCMIKPFISNNTPLDGASKGISDNNHLRFSSNTLKQNIPYLRYKGLYHKLKPMEIGYLLYYFCKHRGASNITESFSQQYGQTYKTIGEMLYLTEAKITDFAINRHLILQEISYILQHQSEYYKKYLNPDIISKIIEIIDFEKPYKAPSPRKCTYFPEQPKIRLSSYYYEKRRIVEFCRNLKIKIKYNLGKDNNIDIPESAFRIIYAYLMGGNDITESKLKYYIGAVSVDSGDLTLDYDIVGYKQGTIVLGHLWAKLKYHPFFSNLKEDKIEETLDYYLGTLNKNNFLEYLQNNYNLNSTSSYEILSFLEKLQPKRGFSKIGETATQIVTRLLFKKEAFSYQEAINKAIKLDLIKVRNNNKRYPKLPHYSKVLYEFVNSKGIISNVVAHKTLNRLRKVINEIIIRYGNINEIILEYSKELSNSFISSTEITLDNYLKEQDNKILKKELSAIKDSVSNKAILLYKLCKQQNMLCPYSGENISIMQIFDGTLEMDHIIPYAISYDNSLNNLVVTTRFMNQKKGKRTPYEAFFGTEYWNKILGFLQINKNFAKQKGWRFREDALDLFKEKSIFYPRYKNDNSYISKLTVRYLQCLFISKNNIKIIKSSFVGILRKYWGLNNITYIWNKDFITPNDVITEQGKNRIDVRHNALDALVLLIFNEKLNYISGKSFLDKYWDNLKYVLETHNNDVININNDIPFRVFIEKVLKNTKISFQVQKKANGQLHKEKIYRLYKNNTDESSYILANKKQNFLLSDIKKWDFSSIENINKYISMEVGINNHLLNCIDAKASKTYLDYIKKIAGCNFSKIHNLFQQTLKNDEKTSVTKWLEVFNTFWSYNPKGYLQFNKYQARKLLLVKFSDEKFNIYFYGYIAGNNFCLDLYYDNAQLKGEIIRRYQILSSNLYIPLYIKQGFKRVQRLFSGDILEVDYKHDHKYLSCLYTGSNNPNRVKIRLTAFTETETSINLYFKLLQKSGYNKDFSKNINSFKKLNPQKLILSTLGFEKYRSNII